MPSLDDDILVTISGDFGSISLSASPGVTFSSELKQSQSAAWSGEYGTAASYIWPMQASYAETSAWWPYVHTPVVTFAVAGYAASAIWVPSATTTAGDIATPELNATAEGYTASVDWNVAPSYLYEVVAYDWYGTLLSSEETFGYSVPQGTTVPPQLSFGLLSDTIPLLVSETDTQLMFSVFRQSVPVTTIDVNFALVTVPTTAFSLGAFDGGLDQLFGGTSVALAAQCATTAYVLPTPVVQPALSPEIPIAVDDVWDVAYGTYDPLGYIIPTSPAPSTNQYAFWG